MFFSKSDCTAATTLVCSLCLTLGNVTFRHDNGAYHSFLGAAEGKDQKFLVINEPGEVKGEEVVGSEEEKVEEDEEELPKLIKSDEKCDEDRGKYQII